MIKKVINNFMIWLNTPHCIDIPWFGESKDAALYDDLYKQRDSLLLRRQRCLNDAYNHFCAKHLKEEGILPLHHEAVIEAHKMFENAKAQGLIDPLNRYVIPEGIINNGK